MRLVRIYQPGDYSTGDKWVLDSEAGQHVGVVLRMKAGESVRLFPGDNREFEAVILDARRNRVSVSIGREHSLSLESPLWIHLAQGISKGDRMEMVVQKAVELGVAAVTPLLTERCVLKLDADRLEKKQRQWQSIAVSACEQTGRNWVPVIHKPLHLKHFLQDLPCDFNFVLSPEGGKTWRDYQLKDSRLGLLIGPEGGFSESEMSVMAEYDISPLQLGPRVLRTETAAVAAISVLQAVFGDL